MFHRGAKDHHALPLVAIGDINDVFDDQGRQASLLMEHFLQLGHRIGIAPFSQLREVIRRHWNIYLNGRRKVLVPYHILKGQIVDALLKEAHFLRLQLSTDCVVIDPAKS